MKIKLLLLVFVHMAFAEQYTLDQCISVALENNHALLESKENVKKSEARVNEAWGNVFPELSLDAKYEYAYDQYNPLEGGSGNPFVNSGTFIDSTSANYDQSTAALAGDIGNLFGGLGESMVNDYQTTASLILTQVLFSQAAWTAPDIAKSYEKLVNEEHQLLKDNVRYEISTSFYSVIYFVNAVKIMNQALEQAQKHLSQAEGMYKSGLVSEIDLLRAQINVQDLGVDVEKFNSELLLAKNALLNKMGLPYSEEIVFVGDLEKSELTVKENEVYETALLKRKEIKQIEYGQELAGYGVTIARADYFPTVFAGGAYTKLSVGNEWNSFEWNDDVRMFAGIKWNLFNGLKTRSKVAQAKTEERKMKINLDKLKNGIKLQVESEWNKIEETEKRIDVRSRLIGLTEKSLKMIAASYENGKATQLEVLDAELEVRKAKLEFQKALLDYTLAYLGIQRAMGIL